MDVVYTTISKPNFANANNRHRSRQPAADVPEEALRSILIPSVSCTNAIHSTNTLSLAT
jgi:hypothetical protein